jgi:putative redox protein
MAIISADLVDGYRVEINNGRHNWTADEPLELGGSDEGPNPYELLLGALASCTSITVAMYASRKEMQLDSISVRYEFDRVHSDDCDECDDDASGFIDRVSSEIFIEGEFTEAERQRLAEVAQRCPVHKTLDRSVHFEEDVIIG